MTTRVRTHTPDEVTVREDGTKSTRIHLKRACNGCGQLLGDVADWDVDDRGELADVRGECQNCKPVVDLEASGCKTWQLTPRNIAGVDHEIDCYGTFAKQYTETDDDGRVVTIGLRIGEKPNHVVALYGDWIIRHPDGRFAVHAAPVEAQQ
ncbi:MULTISPECIES: hypothetical protein [unclassified Streptomyces]|uniref:hypothetical protein n=1 Tax=unclassified Streptomyces TaxID=2593676 RepID=UPI00136FC0FD|nr:MULTISPECIES: hypothetical protein [unclassified Streptomyces]NDZ98563.1 hypothetical protein [Streptomyces sp. SID10116]MYY79711.1 hypothetical protein [Streptomyces sp. SID335]MYZ12815.1 hypothetical protein [Streptomyces sp. SID337]NDZ84552.1 hypothetical protein [Streptomyces sp. SID10115]NEB43516.1 hypothetical protein [Streptomyces sp. SID339]